MRIDTKAANMSKKNRAVKGKATRGSLLTTTQQHRVRSPLNEYFSHELTPLERRKFDFEDLRKVPSEIHREYVYREFSGKPARIVYKAPRVGAGRQAPQFLAPSRLRVWRGGEFPHFENPHLTSVCRKRAERRRVLFAFGRTGKGYGAKSYARWTDKSYIRCS